MNYQTLLNNLASRYSDYSITENDMPFIQEHLHKQNVILLLKEILSSPTLLKIISERSYTHALGFDKLVLMDLSKDIVNCKQKTQLRLHIWDTLKTGTLPIVESLHEHSFDFISTVLTGYLENQQFTLSNLNNPRLLLLDKLLALLPTLQKEQIIFLNEQVEIIEAIKLAKLGSLQLDKMNLLSQFDLDKIKNITQFSEEDIFELSSLEGHYVSNRVAGEKKAYKHILKEYVALEPYNVLSLNQGAYYFHPYQLPHRLYYDNTILNSTILVTTPVKNNPEGGSLQRPTYVQHEEQNYDKISYSLESFIELIKNYIDYLEHH